MSRGGRAIVAFLLVAVAALAVVAWRQHRRVEDAERQGGLDATRMVREVFRAKRDLRVGQLSGVVVATSQYDGTLFHPTQRTRAPVTVNYLLDLGRIGERDLSWDARARVMTVRIPDVTVEAPSIDMARAEVQQDGLWIGRRAGVELQRVAARRIETRANERARADANMASARRAAAEAVARLARQPLAAAGLGPVTVRVLFPWDGSPATEHWDTSRSVGEVLGNAR